MRISSCDFLPLDLSLVFAELMRDYHLRARWLPAVSYFRNQSALPSKGALSALMFTGQGRRTEKLQSRDGMVINQYDAKKRLSMDANETRLHVMRSCSPRPAARFFFLENELRCRTGNDLPLQSPEFS
jgi:hypothetical protein